MDCPGSLTIGSQSDATKGNIINSEGQTGIYVQGTFNALLGANIVLMNTDATSIDRWGIKVIGANSISLTRNKINDPDTDFGSYPIDCTITACSIENKISITILDAFHAELSCNRTNATETGIQFIATTNGVDLEAVVKGNTFQWHDYGLVIGAPSGYASNTSIGEQGFIGVNTPGNYWKGGGSGNFGVDAAHTFNTANAGEIFIINASNYKNGLFFTDDNNSTSGSPINLSVQSGTRFPCTDEIQEDNKLLNEILPDISTILYPNPVVNNLNIDFIEPVSVQTKISLQDILGNTLFFNLLEEGLYHFEINVTPYTPGIYLIIIENELGFRKVMKVFIAK